MNPGHNVHLSTTSPSYNVAVCGLLGKAGKNLAIYLRGKVYNKTKEIKRGNIKGELVSPNNNVDRLGE